MPAIRPDDLPAGVPTAASALIFDNGTSVLKTTPQALVDSARPIATQAQGADGTNNTTIMTPLRVEEKVAGKADLSALTGASPTQGANVIGYRNNTTHAAGTVADRLSNDIYVTDAPFNAVADNSTDCLAAFNAATAAAIAQGKRLVVPRGSYVLSGVWTINFPIDIECDPSTNLRWTTEASAGVDLDFRSTSANFGLNVIRFGGLYSPSCASNFTFPGYPSAWNVNGRSARDAIRLRGGSRIDIYTQYAMGWNAEFRPQATYDVTNGARAPLNINYYSNTGDVNVFGVFFDGGPAGAGSLGAIYCEWNTCFAKYPVYYGANVNTISQCNVRILGQSFVVEPDGALVYAFGANVNTCTIDIPWCYAGYSPYDSPIGTVTTLTNPLVAGTAASNGITVDGNSTLGYFGGANNTIRVGLAIDRAGIPDNPGGHLPAAGLVTRIRDAGVNNAITVNLYERSQGSPVALSQTQGEANYGGGVGAASIAKATLVSVAVPTLANGISASFYFYSTLLSDSLARPVLLSATNSGPANSKLTFSARDNSANVNREGVIEVANLTGASVTGATYFFWVTLP